MKVFLLMFGLVGLMGVLFSSKTYSDEIYIYRKDFPYDEKRQENFDYHVYLLFPKNREKNKLKICTILQKHSDYLPVYNTAENVNFEETKNEEERSIKIVISLVPYRSDQNLSLDKGSSESTNIKYDFDLANQIFEKIKWKITALDRKKKLWLIGYPGDLEKLNKKQIEKEYLYSKNLTNKNISGIEDLFDFLENEKESPVLYPTQKNNIFNNLTSIADFMIDKVEVVGDTIIEIFEEDKAKPQVCPEVKIAKSPG